jgi:hypothetical protein
MADGVAITAGTGTTVATDDVGGVHYQRVKQDYGVDGASAHGGSGYRNLDLDENGVNVKTSAGRLLRLVVNNMHATDKRYVKVYNKASAPVAADTPVFTFPIPVGTPIGAPFVIDFGDAGVLFSAGIGLRATTALADADTGAPAANDVVVNASYV